jgi:hypothetical protein
MPVSRVAVLQGSSIFSSSMLMIASVTIRLRVSLWRNINSLK